MIRAARDLIELEQGTPLAEAATRLLSTSLGAKVDAARVVCRVVELEDGSSALTSWIDRLAEVDFDPPSLLRVCREFDGTHLKKLDPPGSGAEQSHRAELRVLGAQLAGFAYFAATLLEFFDEFRDREFAEQALADSQDGSRAALVDQLAASQQAFSSSVGGGWGMLSAFRAEAGLGDGLPFPVDSPSPAGEGAQASVSVEP